MIKHIVFFSFVDSYEGMSKNEILHEVKTQLEALDGLVPELRKIEIGINHPEAPATNYDLSLYTEFDSMADLDAYQIHPEHKRVAGFIGKVKTERACVDYEG